MKRFVVVAVVGGGVSDCRPGLGRVVRGGIGS